MTRASVVGIVCLGLSAMSGCNTGSRDSKPVYGATIAPPGSGSSPTSALRAVAAHTDLIGGSPNSVAVFVNDPSLTNPILAVDSGAGFFDSGASPHGQPDALFFVTGLAATGSKYRIFGRRGGARVESNTIAFGAYQAGALTIIEPRGDYTGISSPTPTPARTSWKGGPGGGSGQHMVLLYDQSGGLEWVATIGSTSYTWGESLADTYVGGPDPIPSGRHRLTVCTLLDGWATHSSNQMNPGTGQSETFSFEVQ